jgi:ankyrin repeat protein
MSASVEESVAQKNLDEELLHAAKAGRLAEIGRLLALGANAKTADFFGHTPLMEACMKGSLECVERLIPVSDVRHQSGFGVSALAIAAWACPQAVETLIPLSDPLAVTGDGESALMIAARSGEAHSVRLLLPVSDLGQKSREGLNALMLALREKQEGTALMLVGCSDLSVKDRHNQDALMIAAAAGLAALVERLLPLIDPTEACDGGETALLLALKNGHDEAAMRLIPVSNAHARTVDGFGAMTFAACAARPETARALAEAGVSPVQVDHFNEPTPLALACGREDGLEMARFLLPLTDVNAKAQDGSTALMAAAKTTPEIVQLLLVSGADPRAADESGMTALHHAAKDGKSACAAALARVSDIQATTPGGETAEQMARGLGWDECAEALAHERARRLAVAEREALSDLSNPAGPTGAPDAQGGEAENRAQRDRARDNASQNAAEPFARRPRSL